MNLEHYQVKPGKKVILDRWDPADKNVSSGSNEEDIAELERLGRRLTELQDLLYGQHEHKVLVILQGMDTAGKDGTIRHVFRLVHPLGIRVQSFRVPTPIELDHDYLWRVHGKVPGKGEIVIFNRSHYEDVLVVRVHKLISLEECKRRFTQINDFERMLHETGTTCLKFYLHISKDEQKRRLQERLGQPNKRWKLTRADFEERKSWPEYMAAYEDALSNTSTPWAPWYIVPANSKQNRNLFISSVLVKALESLQMKYPEPKEDLGHIVVQ